jgi:hypothetical protein
METENIVRLLTIGSLAGLLIAVGMRLTVKQVLNALRKRGLAYRNREFCDCAGPCRGGDEALRFQNRSLQIVKKLRTPNDAG